jgi:hypothetical protein
MELEHSFELLRYNGHRAGFYRRYPINYLKDTLGCNSPLTYFLYNRRKLTQTKSSNQNTKEYHEHISGVISITAILLRWTDCRSFDAMRAIPKPKSIGAEDKAKKKA